MHQGFPRVRLDVGFLGELALGGDEVVLARWSSKPAGSSQSRSCTGCRYCWITSTRPSASSAQTATAPVWSMYSRTMPSP